MGRWIALALAGAAGLTAAVALTSPARGDLLPTLPVSVPISLNVPSLLFRKNKLGVESEATKMSVQPSPFKSAAIEVNA